MIAYGRRVGNAVIYQTHSENQSPYIDYVHLCSVMRAPLTSHTTNTVTLARKYITYTQFETLQLFPMYKTARNRHLVYTYSYIHELLSECCDNALSNMHLCTSVIESQLPLVTAC